MPQLLRALSLLSLLCLPLPATAAPEPWRLELNAAAGDAAHYRAAVSRAKALFEAEARPALIRAGLGTTEEFLRERDAYGVPRDAVPNDTGKISEILWAFYPFPQVQRQLYDGLLETGLSPGARLERFGGTAECLLACLQSLETGRRDAYETLDRLPEVLAFWQSGGFENARGRAPDADYTAKRAFAESWLPLLLRAFGEDAPTGHLAAMEKLGLPAWRPWRTDASGREKPAWSVSDDQENLSFVDALLLLWEKRNDAALSRRAREIMEDQSLTPNLRWEITQLALRFPGRDREEYARILPDMPGIESMSGCWAHFSRSAYYGLSFGGCEGPVFEKERAERRSAPRIPLQGQTGPGLKVVMLQSPPDLSAAGPLYLLFESSRAAPDFFRLDNANSRPVLTRGAFYYLASGPRLCPLEAGSAEHEKLLAWFWREGAAGGQCCLLASRHPLEKIRADLESWNLTLWEEKVNDPRLVLTLADGGDFLHVLLPRLKGRAAGLLFGHLDALWSAKAARDGNQLFEARPEAALPEPGAETGPGKARPVLVLQGEALSALGAAHAEEKLIRRVIDWQKRYPRNGFTRAEGAAFLERLSAEIRASHPGLKADSWKFQQVQEFLWRTHGTPLHDGLRALLLRKGDETALQSALKEAEGLVRGNDKKTPKGG